MNVLELIDEYRNTKVGIIANNAIRRELERRIIPDIFLQRLQSPNYCRNNYELRSRDWGFLSRTPMIDKNDYLRSYRNPVNINGIKYYINSQLYEENQTYLIILLSELLNMEISN